MTVQCTATADAITGVLLAGDVVLNFSPQPLNTTAETRYVAESDGGFRILAKSAQIRRGPALAETLPSLISDEILRLVVVSEENCPDAEHTVRELAERGVPHLHCTLMSNCDADAFMDEEDTEAVTERLRQLGYI